MKLEVYDIERMVVGNVDAAPLLAHEVRFDLIHQVVLWQMAKERRSIANTKVVSEVQGSTAKLYRQKGTGRARHGRNRRTQFRGGAITFGPRKEREFSCQLNKKVRSLALKSSLSEKFMNNKVVVFDKFSLSGFKTRDFLSKFKECTSHKVAFVDQEFERNFLLANRNVPYVLNLDYEGINILDVVSSDLLFVTKDVFENLVKRFK